MATPEGPEFDDQVRLQLREEISGGAPEGQRFVVDAVREVDALSAVDMLGIGVDAVNIIGAAATALLFVAIFAFPSGRFEPRWTAIPFLLLLPTYLIDSPVVGLVVVLSALIVLISRYRAVGPGMERLQLRWAFFGLGVGMTRFIRTDGDARAKQPD